LSQHLCAFPNTSFGQMILGIEPDKTKDGQTIGIRKKGFSENKKDSIRNEINNAMLNVEPTPLVKLLFINENGSLFPVVQITGEESKKPYFHRSSGKCYVRIGASTVPANRTNIINLFSNIRTKVENLERLSISADFLKEMIMYTCEKLDQEDPKDVFSRITPMNWDLFKSCALSTEWFMKERNLYGGHIKENSSHGGFHSFLYELELFNLDINVYNSETFTQNRIKVKTKIDKTWKPGMYRYRECIGFLEELIRQARTFIESEQK
jgi:Putative DNA-binding domain